MKRTLDHALGLYRKPSQELEQSIQERVAKRLGLATGDVVHDTRQSTRTRRWQWSAVAAIAAAVMLAVVLPTRIAQSALAVLEDANGTRKIHYGEIVQPSGDMSAMLSITDGPRIEARSMSEFSLDRADDGGTRIHLNYGSLVVDAAGQHKGSLYVQTGDMTASVAGAVSLVKAEEQGSRIAAIGGEVRVQQGSREKKLAAGEQMTSNPAMQTLSVKDELAWSREAVSHVALLQQAPAARAAQAPKSERLAFEVASIRSSGPPAPPAPGARGAGAGVANTRPTKEGCSFTTMGWSVQLDPGRLAVTRATVFHLIAWAYPVQGVPARNAAVACSLAGGMSLISGGPEWIKTDMWDIQAGILGGLLARGSFDGSDRATSPESIDPNLLKMLQTLLADRFKLAIHRETREMPIYLLTQGKEGAKFNGRRPPVPGRRMMVEDANGNVVPASQEYIDALKGLRIAGGNLDAMKFTMGELALEISRTHNRPVFDRTGLAGAFDFYLDLRAPAPEGTPRVNRMGIGLEKAIETIGLKLEESMAPIDVWVIDHVEKPSEN